MLSFGSHAGDANDSDIKKVRDVVLTFLQDHPHDIDSLNESLLPFAYLTSLKQVREFEPDYDPAIVLDGILQGRVEIGSKAAQDANNAEDTDGSDVEPVAHEQTQREKRRFVKQGKRPGQRKSSGNGMISRSENCSSSSDTEEILPEPTTSDTACCDFLGPQGIVSKWMSDPEIIMLSRNAAFTKYKQPHLELKSYLNIISSIGTMEVQRSFAVGVLQLKQKTSLSLKVPISPDHLLNVEDAATLQCFWRAAYRAQGNGSLATFGIILHRRSLISLRNCYFKAMDVIKNTMKRKGVPGFTKAAIARGILIDTVFPGADEKSLKKMSDRLKNDVTRARAYCKLVEYYGSSGILGLLPQQLTDTRMRDFTDAEFDIFLDLLKRLRPDLEDERVNTQVGDTGKLNRMTVWGRVIDMAHAGVPPTYEDCKFIQEKTNIILTQGDQLEVSGVATLPSSACCAIKPD